MKPYKSLFSESDFDYRKQRDAQLQAKIDVEQKKKDAYNLRQQAKYDWAKKRIDAKKEHAQVTPRASELIDKYTVYFHHRAVFKHANVESQYKKQYFIEYAKEFLNEHHEKYNEEDLESLARYFIKE